MLAVLGISSLRYQSESKISVCRLAPWVSYRLRSLSKSVIVLCWVARATLPSVSGLKPAKTPCEDIPRDGPFRPLKGANEPDQAREGMKRMAPTYVTAGSFSRSTFQRFTHRRT
jgi:hypothetical protein